MPIDKIFKFLTPFYILLNYISLACMVVLVVLLFLESIIRKMIGVSIITVSEIGGIAMYLFVVLSVSWLYKTGGHLRSDFIVNMLSEKVRHVLAVFLHILTFLFACLCVYLWWKYLFVSTFESGRTYRLTGILEWPFHLLAMISWVMLALAAIEQLVAGIIQVFGRTYGKGAKK